MVPDRSNRRVGFTLIELLVVVAIIALLISILLPSLSQARAQARSTVCASRVSQLGKAMLMYSEDNNETPPFMGIGWENCDSLSDDDHPDGSGTTIKEWAYLEDWLMPDMPDYWMDHEDDWPIDIAQIKNGSIFSYTRFENLYRCPEFERAGEGQKTQNQFNYTRTLLGRKWFDRDEVRSGEAEPYDTGSLFGAPGPILKISQIYAPGRLHMMIDERWLRHCASPDKQQPAGEGLLEDALTGIWMASDCMFSDLGDEIGRYHGAKRVSSAIPAEYAGHIEKTKGGNSVYYDGHAGLETDVLPDRLLDSGWGLDMIFVGVAFLDYLKGIIFSQRGKADVVVDVEI